MALSTPPIERDKAVFFLRAFVWRGPGRVLLGEERARQPSSVAQRRSRLPGLAGAREEGLEARRGVGCGDLRCLLTVVCFAPISHPIFTGFRQTLKAASRSVNRICVKEIFKIPQKSERVLMTSDRILIGSHSIR